MKNKKLLCLLGASLLGLSLTACDRNPDKPGPIVDDNIPEVTKDTKTKISIWSIIGQNNRDTFERAIDSFKEKYPNIEVDNVYQAGNYNQLADKVCDGFTGNNYPDLIQCYPDNVARFIDYGRAVRLDKFIDHSKIGLTAEDKEDYIDTFLEEGKSYATPGTYSMPFCKSTEEMFYNEDVLIGLNLSTVDSTINNGVPLNEKYLSNLTWDELFDKLCPAITEYNNKLPDNEKILKTDLQYNAVFAYDSDDNLFITLAKQYNAPYTSISKTGKGSVDFNNPEMKKIMKKFKQAYDKKYIITKGSAGGKYTNEFFTGQNTLFSVGSTGGVKYQFSDKNPMNVNATRIPQADLAKPYTISQGPGLAILNHNNDVLRQTAAWLLYKELTSAENCVDWTVNTGYTAIRHSVYKNQEYIDTLDVDSKQDKSLDKLMAKSRVAQAGIVKDTFTSPAFKGSSKCRTEVGGLVTRILNSQGADIDAIIDSEFQQAEDNTKLEL